MQWQRRNVRVGKNYNVSRILLLFALFYSLPIHVVRNLVGTGLSILGALLIFPSKVRLTSLRHRTGSVHLSSITVHVLGVQHGQGRNAEHSWTNQRCA